MKGIKNIGSNCYLNCVLQTLFSIENFNNDIKKVREIKDKEFVKKYLEAYNTWDKDKDNIILNPSKLIKSFQKLENDFCLYEQQDSGECLIKLLDHLHNSLKYSLDISSLNIHSQLSMKSKESWEGYIKFNGYSLISKYFTGQKSKSIRCLECNNIFYDFEFFIGINTPISGNISLNKILIEYFKDEYLSRECSKCQKIQNCLIKSNIYHFPKILFFCLKRFDMYNKKINTEISYSKTLSINKKQYNLFAVINHFGSYNSGHYTCLIKMKGSKDEDIWIECDDEELRISQKFDINNNYMMFYICS